MLGKRIRQVRMEENKTITEVAKGTKVSPSLISQIETGKANPSIDTLRAIANFLKVPIGKFFETNNYKKSPVVKKEERRLIYTNNEGIKFYLLSSDLRRRLEFIYSVFKPGRKTGEKLYTHEGEECGLVLKGKIEVTLGEKTYILQEGDSISFESTIPHRLTNIGKTEAVAIWVDTPPSF